MGFDVFMKKRGKFVWDEPKDKGFFIWIEKETLHLAETVRNERGIFFSLSHIPEQTLAGYNEKGKQNRRIQLYRYGPNFINSLILKLGELQELTANELPEPVPEIQEEASPQETIDKAEEAVKQDEIEDYMNRSSEFQETEPKEWKD